SGPFNDAVRPRIDGASNRASIRTHTEPQPHGGRRGCQRQPDLVASPPGPHHAAERLAGSRRKQRHHVIRKNGRRGSGWSSSRSRLEFLLILQIDTRLDAGNGSLVTQAAFSRPYRGNAATFPTARLHLIPITSQSAGGLLQLSSARVDMRESPKAIDFSSRKFGRNQLESRIGLWILDEHKQRFYPDASTLLPLVFFDKRQR